MIIGEIEDDFKKYENSKHLINVSRDEYESLPKFMKNLTSWEVRKYFSYLQPV